MTSVMRRRTFLNSIGEPYDCRSAQAIRFRNAGGSWKVIGTESEFLGLFGIAAESFKMALRQRIDQKRLEGDACVLHLGVAQKITSICHLSLEVPD